MNDKFKVLGEQAYNNPQLVNQIVEEFMKCDEEKRMLFCEKMGDIINEERKINITSEIANGLVTIKNKLMRGLPLNLKIDEEVFFKFGRSVKVIVKEIDLDERKIRVKPIDNVMKEEVTVPPCLLYYSSGERVSNV